MEKSKPPSIALKLMVIAGYVGVCLLLIGSLWGGIWFAVGALCGVGLLVGDELYLHRYYQEKESNGFLVSRSPLFLISLVPLSIAVLFSFGSIWANGLIGAMMLFILLEMLELRRFPDLFQKRFLQGVKAEAPKAVADSIILSATIFFLVIHLLAIL